MTQSPLWHPFTQHKTAGPMIEIARAEGAYLFTPDGRKIIDGISSWWVNAHGHNHPKIVQAVKDYTGTLDQIIFAGFTHEPAQRFAEKLLRLMGAPYNHVFLSDSGSTSVEVALKMAIGFCQHHNKKRSKIVALGGGYHGDTFGAMAAGARSAFTRGMEDYLFEVTHVPPGDLQRLEEVLKAGDAAAFIFEPLVQGAGGMNMYGADVLRDMLALCRKYDVISIADEVMTGFGRTGTMFACDQSGKKAQERPDIMCLSKCMTNGFLPMGATVCGQEIYNAFYHEERSKMFFHSSSFTGNPLACVAAAAALDIWAEEPVAERLQFIAASHEKAQHKFAARDDVENIRQCGTILALDVKAQSEGYLSTLGPRLYQIFLEEGVLLRPLGNTVYILPPYCVTNEDLEKLYDSITIALDRIRDERKQQAA